VNVLRHYDLAVQLKIKAIPNFVQSREKESPRHWRVEQWSPLETTKSEEVEVPETVVAF
jgi:hypothetical protein